MESGNIDSLVVWDECLSFRCDIPFVVPGKPFINGCQTVKGQHRFKCGNQKCPKKCSSESIGK